MLHSSTHCHCCTLGPGPGLLREVGLTEGATSCTVAVVAVGAPRNGYRGMALYGEYVDDGIGPGATGNCVNELDVESRLITDATGALPGTEYRLYTLLVLVTIGVSREPGRRSEP